MKTNSRKELFLNTYFVIFSSCLLYKFLISLFDHAKKEYWGVTEWMINYQGGFVRRGLRGEFVYKLHQSFNIEPYTIITYITAITFCALIFFFVKGFIKNKFPLIVLPFVLFLGNPILSNSWMRADSMILLIFAAIVYILVQKPKLYLVWMNLLAVLGLLIHEIFIFISLPILFLFIFKTFYEKNKNLIKSLVCSSLTLTPTLLASLLVTYYKGTSATAFSIWESWKGIPFPESALLEMNKENMGAIAGIGLSIKGGMSIPAEFAKCVDFGLYGPIVLLVTIIGIYLVLNNINKLDNTILGNKPKAINTQVLTSVLLFQFCTIAPLYIIGDDFSRWIYIWVCSSFILLILVPEQNLIETFPIKFQNIAFKANETLVSVTGNSKALLIGLLVIIGIPLYSWNISETIETSSIYVVLSSISSIIQKII